ncbi:MAG TPA: hypothetical protein VK063_02850 [Beutenbergiaceae bacterium]|nr:hypothetical protein [Beutenbergiaceae bacterium]
MGREQPGNGKRLKRFHVWQGLWRSVFGIDHDGARWDIDVNFLDADERVALYRDGRQERTQKLPARFELDDGARIEVRTSTYGIRRAHLIMPAGEEVQLTPAPGSAERWRANLEQRRPVLSRAISITSFVLLLAAVVIQLPQGIEWLAALGRELAPALPENLASVAALLERLTFTSPWHLDGTMNSIVGALGLAALLERALRLKYNWWLDGMEGLDGSWEGN